MDQQTALLSTGTGSTLLMVLIWLYKTAAGKKIRSRCCERDIEMGFSVEEMSPPTPPPAHFAVNNPLPRQLPPRPASPDFV
jgi:hypothetical protein